MSTTTPHLSPQSSTGIEHALIKNDLSQLNAEQRLSYYKSVCESLGINHLTQPFSYIILNGKLTLYATRACTDQIRSIKGISIKIVSRENKDGIYTVVAQATDKSGRIDESLAAVTLIGLKGDVLANALMKCETKAKRRVTLSICGLGWMDETEVETIPGAKIVDEKIKPPGVKDPTPSPQHPPASTPEKLLLGHRDPEPDFDGEPNFQEEHEAREAAEIPVGQRVIHGGQLDGKTFDEALKGKLGLELAKWAWHESNTGNKRIKPDLVALAVYAESLGFIKCEVTPKDNQADA